MCVLTNYMCHMHTARNPAYGMSVRQAPNDAVNVQSNDEHTYEHIGGKRCMIPHCLISSACMFALCITLYVCVCVCVCVFIDHYD